MHMIDEPWIFDVDIDPTHRVVTDQYDLRRGM